MLFSLACLSRNDCAFCIPRKALSVSIGITILLFLHKCIMHIMNIIKQVDKHTYKYVVCYTTQARSEMISTTIVESNDFIFEQTTAAYWLTAYIRALWFTPLSVEVLSTVICMCLYF